ncbi:hypothetical protein SBV1_1710048 [Verrucomicrobia bacterium]|nr:hypothetical protein SBV1_1710048 [Verrucomicrobiota bacterium]
MPAPVGGLLPKPKTGNFDAVRAGTLLAQTGPQAIPMLTTALKDHNPAVRAASAWALSSLAQSGKDIETALPLLTKALGDGNRSVRQNAATAIKANSIHPRGRVRRTGSGRAGAAINGRVETRPQRPPGPTC